MISALAGSTQSATSASPPSTQSGTGLGTDDFLKLLVAQLKNQDPMNPASGTEFLAQTAQFTTVEKLTQLTQQYTDLITTQRATEATAFLGRTIGYTDNNGNAATGKVDSVSLTASGPVLKIGTTDVPLASVLTVTG
jgi:flagellar basal-body rod modification protein FlgD